MKHIKSLLKVLKSRKSDSTVFYIPKLWNTLGYGNVVEAEDRNGEIGVPVYDYFAYYLESILNVSTSSELKPARDEGYPNLNVYCANLRSLTAWNHYGEDIECGTFLKAITLLPFIREMQINTIYLLPVFRTGEAYKKGDMGSLYAVRDIYKLDKHLHDPRLGPFSEELLQLQFKAFVEACHLLGIKVVLDFVFRTVSRDSHLLSEHPEWFYWIQYDRCTSFKPLYFDQLPPLTYVSDECLPVMYEDIHLNAYLEHFRFAPNLQDPEKWDELVGAHACEDNFLERIEKTFNLTTAPAFSDVVNDFQATWDDVTYLRLSFDTHEKAKKYIKPDHPPYIMQDLAKASVCIGSQVNEPLWKYIKNVIPYYQMQYGIDGARIDMAHALPVALNRDIILNCRKLDEDFILWSEELRISHATYAKQQGFNLISGRLWEDFRKYKEKNFACEMVEGLLKAELPAVATLETHDTLRIGTFAEDDTVMAFLLTLCCFLPNTITMINSGMEFGEPQPLNYGFDCIDDISTLLDADDRMNGKLALFDNYRMHWANPSKDMRIAQITSLLKLKNQYFDLIHNINHFSDLSMNLEDNKVLAWRYQQENKTLFLVSLLGDHGGMLELYHTIKKVYADDAFTCKRVFSISAAGDVVEHSNDKELLLQKYDVYFAVNF